MFNVTFTQSNTLTENGTYRLQQHWPTNTSWRYCIWRFLWLTDLGDTALNFQRELGGNLFAISPNKNLQKNQWQILQMFLVNPNAASDDSAGDSLQAPKLSSHDTTWSKNTWTRVLGPGGTNTSLQSEHRKEKSDDKAHMASAVKKCNLLRSSSLCDLWFDNPPH